MFGDKRGFKVQPADKKYIKEHEHAEEALAPVFTKLGIRATLPEDSKGESHIETNIGLALAAGHADLGFGQAGAWPKAGASHVAAMAISNQDCGPIVLAVDTPAGEVALPAAAWDTEVVITVISGGCDIGGAGYRAGDVRVQKSGRPQEAVRAGPEGLKAYVVFGDRRGAKARPQGGAARALAGALNALTGSFTHTPVRMDA